MLQLGDVIGGSYDVVLMERYLSLYIPLMERYFNLLLL
jgi:hypothetical protein